MERLSVRARAGLLRLCTRGGLLYLAIHSGDHRRNQAPGSPPASPLHSACSRWWALHLGLSQLFYFNYAWKLPVIDGGPLGFLTWTIPLLVGSLAYDAVAKNPQDSSPVPKLLVWSVVLMGLGYLFTCLGGSPGGPPFVKPEPSTPVSLWMMSQRAGSVSYLTFASGVSLAVYALFVVFCDQGNLKIGLFRTFGQNALAAYIVHPMVASAVKPYLPGDSPLWFVAAGFLLYFGICYLLIRYLEKNEIFLRL